MITVIAYTIWLVLSSFIIGNATKQAHEDEAKIEMEQNFKETPHRYHIKDIQCK